MNDVINAITPVCVIKSKSMILFCNKICAFCKVQPAVG